MDFKVKVTETSVHNKLFEQLEEVVTKYLAKKLMDLNHMNYLKEQNDNSILGLNWSKRHEQAAYNYDRLFAQHKGYNDSMEEAEEALIKTFQELVRWSFCDNEWESLTDAIFKHIIKEGININFNEVKK